LRGASIYQTTFITAFTGFEEVLMPQPVNSDPQLVTCPDCGGVLSKHRTGSGTTIPTFECQVGHRYSVFDAVEAKEHQVENTMWTLAGQFEHLLALWAELARIGQEQHAPDITRAAARRQAQLAEQMAIVKRLIQETDRSIDETQLMAQG
jgi:hypothetical protein